jgi:ketosteroid isomerase-like protein
MADAAVDEVLGLEERRWAAMIAKDTATLGELFAEEMSYTHSNALVDSKASYLKAIDERIFDYQGVERSDTDARRVGDTVLLTGRAQIDVAAGGRQVHLNARYTVVYVRKDGRWQFLCWQSTSIPT